jgi:hypothetical protein
MNELDAIEISILLNISVTIILESASNSNIWMSLGSLLLFLVSLGFLLSGPISEHAGKF